MWTDVRTYTWTDGHLRLALLGWLCQRVDLKQNCIPSLGSLSSSLNASLMQHVIYYTSTVIKYYYQCINFKAVYFQSIKQFHLPGKLQLIFKFRMYQSQYVRYWAVLHIWHHKHLKLSSTDIIYVTEMTTTDTNSLLCYTKSASVAGSARHPLAKLTSLSSHLDSPWRQKTMEEEQWIKQTASGLTPD